MHVHPIREEERKTKIVCINGFTYEHYNSCDLKKKQNRAFMVWIRYNTTVNCYSNATANDWKRIKCCVPECDMKYWNIISNNLILFKPLFRSICVCVCFVFCPKIVSTHIKCGENKIIKT